MKSKKSIINISLFTVLIFFSVCALAQDANIKSSNDDVNKAVLKLQQKVLLSEEQAGNVKSVILSYLKTDKKQEDLNKAQSKVASLLDERQKIKYDIIKDDWWKGVNKISAE